MVIKVGMVGDAQIGKTSLMVKYVEGSFDEDYIQTLGTLLSHSPRPHTSHPSRPLSIVLVALFTNPLIPIFPRCQFHGENNFDPQH